LECLAKVQSFQKEEEEEEAKALGKSNTESLWS
jgi:hypothetical protein